MNIKKSLLVIVVLFSFIAGFWLEETETSLRRIVEGNPGLSENVIAVDLVSNYQLPESPIRITRVFDFKAAFFITDADFSKDCRQFHQELRRCRIFRPEVFSTPRDWNMTNSNFPRCDG
ncbi:MAG: hypothetical protein ACOYXC_16390 [Candidatus Rifleibacteriota bacterium]